MAGYICCFRQSGVKGWLAGPLSGPGVAKAEGSIFENY